MIVRMALYKFNTLLYGDEITLLLRFSGRGPAIPIRTFQTTGPVSKASVNLRLLNSPVISCQRE